MIGGRRPLQGRKVGDRRVRVDRPHSPYFRYTGAGMLTAREAATAPRSGFALAWSQVRRSLFGRRLSNEEEVYERLPKKLALPIFSSDAISSSAYAPDEILIALFAGGVVALQFSVEIALAVALMLAIVSTSYRQVCRAYPAGGGAYAVAKENLGQIFGLIAAGALMIDYVMTVAVSTASAVAQAYSVWPGLYDIRVEIGIASIVIITLGNLRGLRESGNIFAVPTYLFLGLALLMIGLGLARAVTGQLPTPPVSAQAPPPGGEAVTLFLLLRAFAGGSVALTGVEAIANGVPAFKPPESRNAANTMTMMAILLGVLFVGFMFLDDAMDFRPLVIGGGPTAIAQLGSAIFGDGSPLFVALQVATALILFLAVNTSFNAFPRLSAILANDGYMPRQFSFRGDRLAFSYGIVILAGVAALLLIVFQGDTHLLIPLYSVGVFVCFTLSQIGMVRHWIADRGPGWWWRASVNAFGGVLTLVVLLVVASVKFAGGAWLVVVLVPTLVGLMLFIHRQYATSNRELALRPDQVIAPPRREERVVVPVSGLSRAVVQAVNVGRAISADVRAVLVVDDHAYAESVREQWARQLPGVALVVVESPYRALTGPFLAYLDVLDQAWTPDKDAPITFVVIPEYVPRHWWERILYNQSTNQLRRALLGRPNTVITNVPYRREEPAVFERAGGLETPPAPPPAVQP
jgi:amino acid transporter